MVEFKKEKNYVGIDRVIISSDGDEFELSLEENGDLYIGFCIPNEDKLPSEKTFKITSDNPLLYYAVDNLFDSFKDTSSLEECLKKYGNETLAKLIRRDNPYYDDKIVWYSDDFSIDTASKLIITKNNDEFYFTFSRSKSKNEVNTYFVCISNTISRYHAFKIPFMNFYKNLLVYEKSDVLNKNSIQRINKKGK